MLKHYIKTFGLKNSPLWQQKTQSFLYKYGVWILVVLSVGIFLYGTNTDEIFENLSAGYYKGYNDCNCDKPKKEEMGIGLIIGLAIILLMALLFIFYILVLIAKIFYTFFFRYILQKSKTSYIILFVIWLLILYNLFWEGLFYTFEHTSLFSNKKTYTLKDYHEIVASVFSYFFLLFIVAYGLIKNFVKNSKEQAELISQKINAETQALKAQINPHFLFNVLNNLYGTAIVEDSPKTAEGIQQLSSIMRHVVEGTKNERISAEKEVQFLYDFVELNKMRIPKRDNIRININIDWDEQPTQIAPLLVIPYIENAFKYGISITQESFIDLNFKIHDQKLSFSCRNSIIKQFDKLEVGTSTGIENTQRRLALNYPHKHSLRISNENNIFEVALEVNLK
ncbi:MAG: sensor histidine kinase [Emticicia sp.]